MKFVRLHKPLGTPVLLNLDNVDYFELGSQDISAVANMTNGDRVALKESLYEVESICVRQGCASRSTASPALKPPPSKVQQQP